MIEAFKLLGKITLDGAQAVESDIQSLAKKMDSAKEKMGDLAIK